MLAKMVVLRTHIEMQFFPIPMLVLFVTCIWGYCGWLESGMMMLWSRLYNKNSVEVLGISASTWC